MRVVACLCVPLMAFLITDSARADVEAGLTVDREGIDSFHFAIGAHYQVGKAKVVAVRDRKILDKELPAVFYLAQQAKVSPGAIVNFRLGGKSWMEITAHLGLTAEVFHVPVAAVPGPPYGRALGHFKNKKRREWATIKLADAEVVQLVNLKFLAAHHGFSPDAIIRLHQKGDSFVKLNRRAKVRHGQAKARVKAREQKSAAKQKARGRPANHEGSHEKARPAKSRDEKKGRGRGKGRNT